MAKTTVTIESRYGRKPAKVRAEMLDDQAIISRRQAKMAGKRAGLISGDYWCNCLTGTPRPELVIVD